MRYLLRNRLIPTSTMLFDGTGDAPGSGGSPPAAAPPAAAPAATVAPPAAPPIPARPAGQTDAERVQQLENTIANTRAEAAANRVEARTAKENEQAARAEITRIQGEATERERVAREAGNTELTATRERLVDSELKAAAIQAGMSDPDLLPLIRQMPAGKALRYNADGTISGITEAIAEAKQRKPDWFKPPASGRSEPAPVVRTGSSLPPPQPGAAPPTTSVMEIPKTAEGKRQYEQTKRDAIRGLRG